MDNNAQVRQRNREYAPEKNDNFVLINHGKAGQHVPKVRAENWVHDKDVER